MAAQSRAAVATLATTRDRECYESVVWAAKLRAAEATTAHGRVGFEHITAVSAAGENTDAACRDPVQSDSRGGAEVPNHIPPLAH